MVSLVIDVSVVSASRIQYQSGSSCGHKRFNPNKSFRVGEQTDGEIPIKIHFGEEAKLKHFNIFGNCQ